MGEILVTSTAEAPFPRGTDFVFVLLNQLPGASYHPRSQAVVSRQLNPGLDPELRLAPCTLHMDMRSRLLPGEELEAEASDLQDRWRHATTLP